jgi:hypothetical protein
MKAKGLVADSTRRKGCLLDIAVVVVYVAVENKAAVLVEREVVMGPHLGHIKGVVGAGAAGYRARLGHHTHMFLDNGNRNLRWRGDAKVPGLFGSHDLDIGLPHDLAALVDVLPQIALGKVGIETAHGRRLGVGEVAHASLREEVILDVVLLAWCTPGSVHPHVKRVRGIAPKKERPFRRVLW